MISERFILDKKHPSKKLSMDVFLIEKSAQ